MSGPLDGLRVLDLGTRIAAPFCAGLLGEQGAEVIKIEQPARRRLHARDRPVRPDTAEPDGPGYSLFWAVEGRGRKSVTLDLRTRRGPGPVPAARRDRRRRRRELPARHARAVAHRPDGPRPAPRHRAHLARSARTARTRRRPGLDRVGIGYGGLLHLTGYPDRPPVRVGVTISDYLTGVFAAQAATAALYARDASRVGRRAR